MSQTIKELEDKVKDMKDCPMKEKLLAGLAKKKQNKLVKK